MLAVPGGDGFVKRCKIDAVAFARKLAAGCEMDDLGRNVSDIFVMICRLGGFLPGGGFRFPGDRDGFSVGTGHDLTEKVCPVDRDMEGGQAVERGLGRVAVVVIRADADHGVFGVHGLEKFCR